MEPNVRSDTLHGMLEEIGNDLCLVGQNLGCPVFESNVDVTKMLLNHAIYLNLLEIRTTMFGNF